MSAAEDLVGTEPISFKAFRGLAKKGSLIRWSKSGIVEWLTWKDGEAVVKNPLTGKSHSIFPFISDTDRRVKDKWYCEEVPLDQKVSVGTIIDAMKHGKALRIQDWKEMQK